jgi:hypothetical protein
MTVEIRMSLAKRREIYRELIRLIRSIPDCEYDTLGRIIRDTHLRDYNNLIKIIDAQLEAEPEMA